MSNGASRLDEVLAGLLDQRQTRNQLRRLTLAPPNAADFSSNSYLSLSSQAAVQKAFLAWLQAAASPSLLGSGGSRLLDGNSSFAEELEKTIAAFHHASAGLLFNSAMDANVGLLGCVPQPGDVVVYDELVHASVHDGMRLSRAGRRVPFGHSRVWDGGDVSSLEGVLRALLGGPDGDLFVSGKRNVFVVVEGVYSMDGDVAPLGDVVECVERCLPLKNGYVIVDEAHSTGVFGDRGRGLVCELGLEDRVWARVLGFGKAMGCSGGIVLCSPTTRSYLINYARTLIYTTAMGFPALASIEATYNFLTNGQAEPLRDHLRLLVRDTHKLLVALCGRHNPPSDLLRVNTQPPRSPIIPVFTCRPRSLATYCQQRGFMVRPIVAPTVPAGKERIRVCLHAGNTMAEVEGLVRAIEAWITECVVAGTTGREGGALDASKGKPKL
ncbi:pyridoxal phosphate-dependent transferase [Staphylotrichum tortipilum]|uniref:Pyridoxal phosphate-dependent transferase n=1 Tax=Staphylotrichum tortipilum TaxID=2831512 RepID=A0AAN6MEE1_9PEZI|nr:pyridoxal phosphate-dependent transferase [Staphylotrichum longicolle]